MKERSFALQKDKKSALDAETASQTAPEKTSADNWKTQQQKVSKKSPNLYAVTENTNEEGFSGDGYQVKNGDVKGAGSGYLRSFFQTKYSDESVEIEETPLKVVKHKSPGLVLSPGATPKLEQLVKEEPQGTPVLEYVGTVNAPNISKEISDKYLFTDQGPNQNDVKQVGVGDCYFWGAVLQILAHDPSKFTSMMKLNGTTVETTLFYKKGKKWVEGKFTRPIGIGGLNAQYQDNADRMNQRECGVCVDTENPPCESAWNAVIDYETCKINRTDYFKAALWANCLEQVYSDFSREHGKYGSGLQADVGDEEFEGGCSDSCMKMFYGSKASGPGTFRIKKDDDGYEDVIKTLIKFKKTLNSDGKYTALVARRAMGDPNTNSAHAYSIENVSFYDKDGNVIDFTDNKGLFGFISDHKEKKGIDPQKSKILLRNPWNSPTSDKGKFFEITLEEFTTNAEWTHLRCATAKRAND